MLNLEIKKIFFKHFALVSLTILLIVKCIGILVSGYDSHYMIDENENYYLDYIEKYSGIIDSVKENQIENEYYKIIHNEESTVSASQRKNAFQVIYHQFLYQKEIENGRIFDDRGWRSFLGHSQIDYILLIGIIVFCTLVFSVEYESEMDILILASKFGKYRSSYIKLFICLLFSAAYTLLFQIIQIIYYYLIIGLPYKTAPLKCLEMFENTRWNISLGRTVFYVVFFRILGSMFVAMISVLFVVIIKKIVLAMVTLLSAILVLDIIVGNNVIAYYLPIGLLKATGFFMPDKYLINVNDNGDLEKYLEFRAISAIEMRRSILIIVFCTVLLIIINHILISKCDIKNILLKARRGIINVIPILLAVLLAGCGTKERETDIIVGNSEQVEAYYGNSQLYIDQDKNTIYLEDNGKSVEILRSAFPMEMPICKIFVYKNICYYLMESDEDSGIYIRKINLDTLEDEYVFSNLDTNIQNFYGVTEQEKNYQDIFNEIEPTKWFFVADGFVYIRKENYIRRLNIRNGASKIVVDQLSDEPITYFNRKFCYKCVE